jgi:hypothetical protein
LGQLIKSQWTQLIKRLSAVTVLGLTIAAPAWAIDPTVTSKICGPAGNSFQVTLAFGNSCSNSFCCLAIAKLVLGLTIAAPAWAIDPTVKELRIGFQKSSINFAIAKLRRLINCVH